MPDFSDDDPSPHTTPTKTTLSNDDKNIPLDTCDLPKNVENTSHIHEINGEIDANLHPQNATTTEIGTEITEANDADLKNDNLQMNGCLPNMDPTTQTSDTATDDSFAQNLAKLAHLSTENCGFPLQIFTKGYLCHPYLSLPYLDLLADVNVRGYVVGATNVLFKQKRQLYDILVDIEANRIECQDLELRKLLHLTTEDLRFADYIVKHVAEERHDVFLDGVGWEGGDEWIRAQFRIYMFCLLRTSLLEGEL